jgi:hypothetical protein
MRVDLPPPQEVLRVAFAGDLLDHLDRHPIELFGGDRRPRQVEQPILHGLRDLVGAVGGQARHHHL